MSRETVLVKNGDGTWTVKDQVWSLPKRYELNKVSHPVPWRPLLFRPALTQAGSATQVLGAGAYGCVCRATDHEDEEEVAVKRIEDVFISKTDALRILREVPCRPPPSSSTLARCAESQPKCANGWQISILKRLRHANIVRLLNVINPISPPAQIRTMYVMFEYGGAFPPLSPNTARTIPRHVVLTPACTGMDLHKFEALDRYLTEDEIKTVMLQLCEVCALPSSIYAPPRVERPSAGERAHLRVCGAGSHGAGGARGGGSMARL